MNGQLKVNVFACCGRVSEWSVESSHSPKASVIITYIYYCKLRERVAELKERVAELRSCVAELKERVAELGSCVNREVGLGSHSLSHSSPVPNKPYSFCGRKAP